MRFLALLTLLLGGCTMLSTPMLETADVLARKQVAVTIGGGGGGGYSTVPFTEGIPGGAFGGGLRLRVGVGHDEEVGIDTVANGFTYRDEGQIDWAVAARINWKVARDGVALIVGSGIIVESSGLVLYGGDAAVVSSTGSVAGSPKVHFYGGGRVGFLVPATADPYRDGIPVYLTLPLGFAFDASDNVRFFVEGGPTGSLGFSHGATGALYGASGGFGMRFAFPK
jgi:hypothetical protein